jgi:hypothetical protein
MTKFQTPWVADREGVVHFRNCSNSGTAPSPYTPVVPLPPDAPIHHVVAPDELVAHLGRPDSSNGHTAPSTMRACADCIEPLLEEDNG